jgi:exodeoxyribonuclease V beta subunit
MTTLDLRGPIPRGRVLLEASAGTGKTYALTALIVRSLAEGLVDVDGLLVVTFTRSATREIADRVRGGIDEARAALRRPDDTAADWLQPLVAGSANQRAACLDRLEAAAVDLDRATVTTIHGFCKVALRHLGAHGGLPHDTELDGGSSTVRRQVIRDALLAELLDDPEALTPDATDLDPGRIEAKFNGIVKGALQNRSADLTPDAAWPDSAGLSDGARRWETMARAMKDEVIARRQRSDTMDFDDLVVLLHEALHHPDHGNPATRRLRERFRMVYIDEFQDTDTFQWQVFNRAFLQEPPDDPTSLGPPSDVTVVGDPKQAIYRFRGADIDAYLNAAEAAGTDGTRLHLDTNHRSDGDLVETLNVLYRGATFGSPRIGYLPVAASAANPTRACGLPPVSIRWMRPNRKDDGSYMKTVGKADTDPAVLTDLANEVGRLLSGATITIDGKPVQVRAGDIAILVPAHAEAELVVQALRDRGIPVIRTRVGSVLESKAALHLRQLLRGMRRPSDLRAVRGAAVSFFVDAPINDLTDDDSLVVLQGLLAQWAEVSTRFGLPSLLQGLRADPDVLTALLADGDGPRHLTDLEHLVELLHVECEGRLATPANALRALADLMAEAAADAEVHGEEIQRRIATDAECVQVSTIHGAKGLEYPIVLLPFAAKQKMNKRPYSYRAHGRRFLDAADVNEWTIDDQDHDNRKDVAKDEMWGDEQRLLYVGLTRARHRVVAWWRPTKGVDSAGLTRLLFGPRDTTGTVDTSQPSIRPPGDEYARHFAELETLTGGRLKTSELPQDVQPDAPVPAAAQSTPSTAVAAVDTTTFTDDDWRTWSFSAFTKDQRLEDPLPVTGGADEPTVRDNGPTEPASGLTDMPAGPDVGTFLHEVLEHLDFQSPTIRQDLVARLDGAWQLRGANADGIADGLLTALSTPLTPVTDTRLVDVRRADRLDEMAFDLRLSGGGGRVAIADVCRTIPEADPDDPFAGYFADLADRTTAVEAGGHLVGFIDLVLRIPGEDGPRFLVVDHKSNRLHRPGDPDWSHDYAQAPMRTAMTHRDYPLQAFLYTVALHRYLRWRLAGGYDPSTHLAGSAYLFLRGMTGATDADGHSHGVSWWRPPTDAVLACDRLLAGRP